MSKSVELFERARRLIPAASQTMSKSYDRFVQGVTPTLVESGKGAYLKATDGKWYLDFGMGLGAAILGYSHPVVNEAIEKQLRQGTLFSLPATLEGEVAEELLRWVPWAEQVRFGKNGTDVTTAAVRLARAYTKRDKVVVIRGHYHGWGDWFIGALQPGLGIPDPVKAQIIMVEPSIDALDALSWKDIAAVILEPIPANAVELDLSFLSTLRHITQKAGALLIFDEVFCGFRYRMGSAQPLIHPDLACFGKALSNGMPLSAVVGKREIMKLLEPGRVFFSGTAGGECLSLAAALATMRYMARKHIPFQLEKAGITLRDAFNELVGDSDVAKCTGLGPRTVVSFKDKAYKDLFQQVCAENCVLFIGAHNMSEAHTDREILAVMDVYEEALDVVRCAETPENAARLLKGPASVVAYR